MKERLASGEGSAYIFGVFLLMSLLVVLSALLEYFRIYGTIDRVEQAYEKAMLSVAISNYDEIFTSVRENSQVGGMFFGGNEMELGSKERPEWSDVKDMGDISQELANLLDISELEGGLHAFDRDGNLLYSIENMNMSVHQTESYHEPLKYEIEGDLQIRIPVYFMGAEVYVLEMKLPGRAVWKSKL